MSNPANVNDVITDSVSQGSTLLTGFAAPQGMAMLDIVSAETMGMAMHNAIAAQQNAQLTTNASITSACAKMLAMEPPVPAPAVDKDTPPPFMPLTGGDGKGSVDPSALINMAQNLAENAVTELKKSGTSEQDAQQAINQLISKLTALSKGTKTETDPKTPTPTPGDDGKKS